MILPSGIDLCDLTQGNDFAGSLQDVEAWDAEQRLELELLDLETSRAFQLALTADC